jgi:hypothetical protein
MLHRSLLPLAALAALAVAGSMPSGKIYGVNLGSWSALLASASSMSLMLAQARPGVMDAASWYVRLHETIAYALILVFRMGRYGWATML